MLNKSYAQSILFPAPFEMDDNWIWIPFIWKNEFIIFAPKYRFIDLRNKNTKSSINESHTHQQI